MNRGLRGCRGLEQLKNQTPYNRTFVQHIVVTAMQAVEGVPTGFAISILTRTTKLRHQGEPS